MAGKNNGNKGTWSAIISIIATVISLVSLVITIFLFSETRRANRYQLNVELQYESERMMRDHESLMLLHGIDPEEVKKDSITIEEFYYVFSSMRASEAYYIINNGADPISKFRTHFLNNDKVERIYKKYLRNKLIASPVFVNLVDQYYLSKDSPNYYNPE